LIFAFFPLNFPPFPKPNNCLIFTLPFNPTSTFHQLFLVISLISTDPFLSSPYTQLGINGVVAAGGDPAAENKKGLRPKTVTP